MRNQWDLYVKNFGRIKEATITVSPFMMFVGKNNTGKSYLMMLLWGILTESEQLIRKDLKKHPQFEKLEHNTKVQLNKNDEAIIDIIDQDIILNIFNDILNENKEFVLQKIFNFPITLSEIRISRKHKEPFKLKRIRSTFVESINLSSADMEDEDTSTKYEFLYRDKRLTFVNSTFSSILIEFFLRFVTVTMIRDDFFDSIFQSNKLRQPLYLPASRTGFMQTYRAIVGNTFDETIAGSFILNEDDQPYNAFPGTTLTYPISDFLSRLQKYNIDTHQPSLYNSEQLFLNTEILKGNLNKNEYNQFVFTPLGSQVQYPLHVTSSLISELAPLSIFLSSDNDPDLWIIEEVEAHLHTEMQLKMARFLFRLVNKDKAIWITTHSDTLAQQINNLLTIAQRNDKDNLLDKLNYSEQDIISDLDLVHAYQFENVDDHTVITKLELGPYGFEMKTFNDTLEQLIKETDMIQNHVE
ncbi:AAA family ATPase [Paenibacillus wenxiniae]|uniref:AAA family ATPase n=1 Tax=Paenibacillus wenxiniae TaxID=1636843 RepID=A0ABW4RL04_9BACL